MTVSVCMATYNGERFLREQLNSILTQLNKNDEIVVVDDASTDATLAVLTEYKDDRIRVFPHSQNRGVIKSFGHALQEARGDIIFLADQDDIWREDKLQRVIDCFTDQAAVTLVQSNYSAIDKSGDAVECKRHDSRDFHPGLLRNIVKNRYHGCAMAFRRSILEYCLPFPDNIPMHDMWIGMVNDIVGKAAYLDEPLVLYRRHGANATLDRHASVTKMVRWRWNLVTSITVLYICRILGKRIFHIFTG